MISLKNTLNAIATSISNKADKSSVWYATETGSTGSFSITGATWVTKTFTITVPSNATNMRFIPTISFCVTHGYASLTKSGTTATVSYMCAGTQGTGYAELAGFILYQLA